MPKHCRNAAISASGLAVQLHGALEDQSDCTAIWGLVWFSYFNAVSLIKWNDQSH